MENVERKAFVDKAEGLIAAIRSGVLVHAQEGVHPRHLRTLLDPARSLNTCANKIEDERVASEADALDAWLTLLAAETEQISHTRIRRLLDQISEVEVALIASRSGTLADNVGDFIDESFETLQVGRTPDPPSVPSTNGTAHEFEIDAEMLEVFREEAASLLQNIKTNLDLLVTRPDHREALWEIKRSAHTFKGAAGIVGLKSASELAHRIEDRLDRLSDQDSGWNAALIPLLVSAAECLSSLSNGERSPALGGRIASLHRDLETVASVTGPQENVAESYRPEGPATTGIPDAEATPARVRSSVVRISLDRLDELVGNVRELVITRSAFQRALADLDHQVEESLSHTVRLRAASGKIEDLSSTVSGMRGPTEIHGRIFQQNAYELTETAKDSSVIDLGLESVKDGFEALFRRQEELVAAIQERLMRLRNVEFGTIAKRLQRTVRVICDEEGKEAELVLENGSVEIDTQVIDALIEPLMHLLKNAVVHGIEVAETRRLLGKPEVGKVTVRVERANGGVVLSVGDDGRGIAFQTLVDKAVTAGLISRADSDSMGAEQIRDLMFLPGLTTAETLNLNAGRGVGMSIVRESVEAAGGTIWYETLPQRGTTFHIRLPLPYAEISIPETEAAVAIETAATGILVLVVDDSPSVRLTMSRSIERNGWRVVTARNGVDALEKLAAAESLPDVILSDIEMPMMGGYEFIAALRQNEILKQIPLVFISSRTGDLDRRQAMAAGAAEYLTKPHDERTLSELVYRLAMRTESVPAEPVPN